MKAAGIMAAAWVLAWAAVACAAWSAASPQALAELAQRAAMLARK